MHRIPKVQHRPNVYEVFDVVRNSPLECPKAFQPGAFGSFGGPKEHGKGTFCHQII